MKYRGTSLTIIASLTGLVTALGCGSGSASDETDLNSDGSALTRGAGPTRSAGAAKEDEDEDDTSDEDAADDEEENDRIVCAVDADCDSDEVCTNGLCSDPPGQADDEDGAVCEADDEDNEDEADDEEENDRIVCAVDADCDSDEVCSNGLCSDPPGQADDEDGAVCEADDEDDEDEADDEEESDRIVCTVDSNCDSDEVCTSGLCSDP